jgi:hypothetical protein
MNLFFGQKYLIYLIYFTTISTQKLLEKTYEPWDNQQPATTCKLANADWSFKTLTQGLFILQNLKGDATNWVNQNRSDAGSEAGDSASKLQLLPDPFLTNIRKM